MRLTRFAFTIIMTLNFGTGIAAQDIPPSPGRAAQGPGLSDLLAKTQKPAGPDLDSQYAAVPPDLDAAVRALAMDNFTSAAAQLHAELARAPEGQEKACVLMWLGLTCGLQAMSYPETGWETGASATKHLQEAISIDTAVMDAPDTARILAEMVGHGWTAKDPAAALVQAERQAEESRRAVDFYYAGVISRRLAARAWAHSDTTDQDKKTLSLFAKAVARDPSRYESWSGYLPALLPVGMHYLATAEATAMYEHFQDLRTPLLSDQGPAVLRMSNSSQRTMAQDEALLNQVAEKWPDSPMPPFEMAMRAIESTPSLAMKLFPELIERLEKGKLKPLPREAGYYPSALYKYAFLLQTVERHDEAIEVYRKLREVSPAYAEVNLNIAILLALKSDEETTGAKKLELLEEAMTFAREQEKLDYRGKAAEKATEIRRKLQSAIFRVRQAIAKEKTK